MLLAGDSNREVSENVMGIFLYQHDLTNLVEDKTCFKNANNPTTGTRIITTITTINNPDLFWTNNSSVFQDTTTAFTSLSDCHKLVLTALKKTFSRLARLFSTFENSIENQTKEIFYRDYKKFNRSNLNDLTLYPYLPRGILV